MRRRRRPPSAAPVMPPFASTPEEAEGRFEHWRRIDPFPAVVPALLNSADLLDYVATVGMLHPYNLRPSDRPEWLKPASCAVACTGEFLRYELNPKTGELRSKPVRGTLAKKENLLLPANSITYLQLGTTFRIPDYIAARFNLAIREIHRGILVGTGPLVDPGFVGRLLIPLHNLTANEYIIDYGEPIVWVEFTKLSPTPAWNTGASEPRRAEFAPFPARKNERKTPEDYLYHANKGKPIASSIPREIAKATRQAKLANRGVRNLRWAGALGLLLAALGGLWPIAGLISETNSRIDQAATDNAKLRSDLVKVKAAAAHEAGRVAGLKRQVSGLRVRLTAQAKK
jgi:deoxycytidine triphosphate deaminase